MNEQAQDVQDVAAYIGEVPCIQIDWRVVEVPQNWAVWVRVMESGFEHEFKHKEFPDRRMAETHASALLGKPIVTEMTEGLSVLYPISKVQAVVVRPA